MKKSLITVVSFLLVLSSLSLAQTSVEIDQIESATGYNYYDYNYVGNGARAKGMGNAFLGVSNDVTAGAWNPAGLFGIEKTVLSLSWSNLSPTGSSSSISPTDTLFSDHLGSFRNISSANFVSSMRIKGHPFVLSANLTRNFNVFNQMSYRTILPQVFVNFAPNGITYFDTTSFDYQQEFETSGGVNSVNFGFGTRLYDNISFGIAVNIYTGNSILEVNETIHFDSVRYNITQWAEVDRFVTLRDTNKFSGTNFTVGFKRDGDKLDVGLTVRTPFELHENRQQSIFQITEINDLINSSATDTTFFQDILYKYDMPWIIGLGFGYQANEDLLLAADFEYRPFSGGEIKRLLNRTINPGGDNEEEFEIIDPQWKNVFTLRLGAEYIKVMDFGDIPIRAGYSFVPVADPGLAINTDNNGTSLTTVTNQNFSLGTGIHWSQIMFDIAYTYTTANRDFAQLNGEMKFKNHNIDFSFTGVF